MGRYRATPTMADWECRLCVALPEAVFSSAELRGLPDPVRRYFRTAIAEATPLARCVRIRMHGRIKVGRWLPFSARQVLNPQLGFVWYARAAGIIAGSDRYIDDAGAMNWRVAGLVTVAHGEGCDVSRSAAGRAAAEAIWVPTALLPRFGVIWSANDENHITARHQVGSTPVELNLTLDPGGRIRSIAFDRWGDPEQTGSWKWQTFGGEITGYRCFAGLTIPSAGRLGWHFGTDGWAAGEFFRYDITAMEVVSQPSNSVAAATL
jgi:hypothetical protein